MSEVLDDVLSGKLKSQEVILWLTQSSEVTILLSTVETTNSCLLRGNYSTVEPPNVSLLISDGVFKPMNFSYGTTESVQSNTPTSQSSTIEA